MENNLQSFISHIGKSGIAKKDRYVVEIKGPGQQPVKTREVNLMCESISFPGQNIRSVPDTLRFGPAREHGQGITFGPFTAQFICSSDMREKRFFEWWQSMIIGSRWEPNYYDNYKGSLLITQLGEYDQSMYQIKVMEAYPKTIMPQDMGYAQNNAYHTLGIEFTYRYWVPLAIGAPSKQDEFEAFSGGAGAVEDRDALKYESRRASDLFAGFVGGRGLTQYRAVDQYNTWQMRRGQDRFEGEGNDMDFAVYGGRAPSGNKQPAPVWNWGQVTGPEQG